MLTHSGLSICPNELALPTPHDVAIQMGRITRYGGAIWCPLLFHSLLVARMVADDSDAMTTTWALFHDAHEIVLGEIPHPWKCCETRADYETDLDQLFQEALGLSYNDINHLEVKQADRAAVHVERLVLGPLANWEAYRDRFDADFDPGDLDVARDFAEKLKWGGYAEAMLCTRVDSGPILRAERLFKQAYAHDYSGVVMILKEMTI
jgi:hypothetical protein